MNGKIETQIIELLNAKQIPYSIKALTIAIKGDTELKHTQSVLRACKNLQQKRIIVIENLYSIEDCRSLLYATIVPEGKKIVYVKDAYCYVDVDATEGYTAIENVKPIPDTLFGCTQEIKRLKAIIEVNDAEVRKLLLRLNNTNYSLNEERKVKDKYLTEIYEKDRIIRELKSELKGNCEPSVNIETKAPEQLTIEERQKESDAIARMSMLNQMKQKATRREANDQLSFNPEESLKHLTNS